VVAPDRGFGGDLQAFPGAADSRPNRGRRDPVAGEPLTEHVHLAFGVDTNEAVDAFHRAAIDAGYTDNGAPGERAVYHTGYYGAFVLDPDGHNIEAVNHNRTGAS
jgi:predicted lactoylglutathione lyase